MHPTDNADIRQYTDIETVKAILTSYPETGQTFETLLDIPTDVVIVPEVALKVPPFHLDLLFTVRHMPRTPPVQNSWELYVLPDFVNQQTNLFHLLENLWLAYNYDMSLAFRRINLRIKGLHRELGMPGHVYSEFEPGRLFFGFK